MMNDTRRAIAALTGVALLLLATTALPGSIQERTNHERSGEGLSTSALAWGTTELVSTESVNTSYSPSLAIDGLGNIHVAWNDNTDYEGAGTDYDIFYKRRNASTGEWTPTEVVTTGSSRWLPPVARGSREPGPRSRWSPTGAITIP